MTCGSGFSFHTGIWSEVKGVGTHFQFLSPSGVFEAVFCRYTLPLNPGLEGTLSCSGSSFYTAAMFLLGSVEAQENPFLCVELLLTLNMLHSFLTLGPPGLWRCPHSHLFVSVSPMFLFPKYVTKAERQEATEQLHDLIGTRRLKSLASAGCAKMMLSGGSFVVC